MPRQMTEEEAFAFIDSAPGWATLSSIGLDGYPHSIPIGWFRLHKKIYMGCIDQTQKIKNIERNEKISVCIESGSTMKDIKGVLLRGNASIIRLPEDRLALSLLAAKSRGVEEKDLPKEASPNGVYIELSNFKITSWDYAN